MGVKFNRRIKLAKGVNLNIGKKGVNSISFKIGKTTINPTKNIFSYNSSIKGVSYQGKLVGTNDTKKANGNIDTVNNINSVNSSNSSDSVLSGYMNIIEKSEKAIEGIKGDIMEYEQSIQRMYEYKKEALLQIEDIKNDTELTEEEKERLINTIETECIIKGDNMIKETTEKIEGLKELIKSFRERKREAEEQFDLYVMNDIKNSSSYSSNNSNREELQNVIREAEEILGINNNKGLKNDTEGTIFAIILIGIIFLFVAIMCS